MYLEGGESFGVEGLGVVLDFFCHQLVNAKGRHKANITTRKLNILLQMFNCSLNSGEDGLKLQRVAKYL